LTKRQNRAGQEKEGKKRGGGKRGVVGIQNASGTRIGKDNWRSLLRQKKGGERGICTSGGGLLRQGEKGRGELKKKNFWGGKT